ncbi:MAG: 30S ribosomal protein S1 [Pseudomonadota bacterium]|nr:30S ribosomal protein S1 [Alphaproteobacteria bacterium]MCS5596653.1 30S ribosomal protein S1 [Alphaproteobacteria bacterium]MEC7702192.1 30S ribosomal protein S1 [Pseudomonadota bacterium]|tara:strand:+ start:256 stop:1965 length:1710 start_codon:yes stop_codon:yes gene_type:complete
MAHVAANLIDREESREFASLLAESLGETQNFEGKVVKGKVVGFESDLAVIDVGLKSEGRVELREFTKPGEELDLNIGDEVEVFIERMEGRDGMTSLSREKARREEAWVELEKSHEAGERVTGIIFSRVKGGFTVDLGGAVAFLPGSQVDIRPVRDVSPLMGTPQPFYVLKMDKTRGNIVVSRRAVLEESRAEARSDLMENLGEGQVLQGVVKNITDYGAFIDLGGVDGLLHVTDISWKRVNHPSEVLEVGKTVDVQVIRYNEDTGRISLGMKQLEQDPWEGVADKYVVGSKFTGRVTNITDYGAFVELGGGIEGLVHVSEMSWTKKNAHPGKIVSTSQEVEVMVLDVDQEKRRISLGIKQCQDNPWTSFAANHKVGQELEGEIRNITEFGLFVGMPGDIDGMVHLSDVSWEDQSEDALKAFNKGDSVKVKILDIDADKERVALGIKQLAEDPYAGALDGVAKGAVVTGTITEVNDKGVEVSVNDKLTGFIKKVDLSRERSEQRPDRFAVGEKVDAKVLTMDAKSHKLGLSIKARELDEDKKAMEEFGSTEAGASLGDILGAALNEGDKK